MRITLLTPGTGHFYCGSCLRDSALARSLHERGHDVQIVPLYLPFVLEDHGLPEQPIRMGGINMYLQQKLPVLRHAPHWLAGLLDAPGLLRWASTKSDMTDAEGLGALTLSMLKGEEGRQSRELEKLVAALSDGARPDVVCLSNVLLAGLVRRLKQDLGAPVLCTLQGEAPFLDALPGKYSAECWSVLAERARDIDGFVPVSRYYGDLMRERLGLDDSRVHVVHNGIDLADLRESPAPQPGVPTIGYMARMCPDKGLPTLVDAFVELKRRGSIGGLRLRAAGVLLRADEAPLRELERRLEAAGFRGDAEFRPNVERREKLELLRSLSVFSVPATYGESFGLYLLEALALGVPVVQPRHGAFPEILDATGGGVLCEPDDPVSLADGLEQLLLDPERARAMGARARAVVLERFGVERMAREVEDVCRMVASN